MQNEAKLIYLLCFHYNSCVIKPFDVELVTFMQIYSEQLLLPTKTNKTLVNLFAE